MSHSLRLLVRGGLLLAIGALSQQLRLVLPLPVPVMTLLIGTLVNAVLVLAGRYTTRLLAWVICVALAVIAFFQGHILGPVVPVIALGNGMYVELTRSFNRGPVLFLGAPLGKAVVLPGFWRSLSGDTRKGTSPVSRLERHGVRFPGTRAASERETRHNDYS